MSLDWGQVKEWCRTRSELDQLYEDLSARATSLSDLQGHLELIRNDDAWEGQAEHAAQATFDEVDDDIVSAAAAVGAVRAEVAQTSAALSELATMVSDAENYARANGFSIQDNGAIADLWQIGGVTKTAAEWDQHDAVEEELSRKVTAVRERGNEIETEASRVLWAASQGEVPTDGADTAAEATTVGSFFAMGDMPPPQQIEDWWNGLGTDQQQWVLQSHPDWVRNLDGIPVVVRDPTNRAFLDSEIAQLEREIGFAPGDQELSNRSPVYYMWLRWRELTTLRQALRDTPDSFLIGLDTEGGLIRAITSVGNPDKTDHIAVTIPGMGSQETAGQTMRGMLSESSLVRTEAMSELLDAERGGESVAIVSWMNYNTPPDIFYAASDAHAEAGAPVLSNYLESIDVTSTGSDDPHLTLVGHSYGSLVSGLALTEGANAVVDDYVAYGSPGFYAADESDLGMQQGHVYVMRADDDLIRHLDLVDGWYGSDPVDGSFVQLSSEATTTPDGVPRDGAAEHADYPRPFSRDGVDILRTTGYNVAVVVAGLPENAVPR
ncbi:MAG: alpha/beta hydrolase [Mycobacterium sp.]